MALPQHAQKKHTGIKLALYINYFVFAILLNSVGIVIKQSLDNYGVTETQASILEAFKDLPIAIVSFLVASFLPKFGYKNSMLLGLAMVFCACLAMYFGNSFDSAKLLFATIGEELGMVGMLVVILMFFWVVRRCFEIGRQAIAFEEFFNGLVAQGIGLWIGLQVFINLGVNLGLLPTKGLTLPFMSFGGTAILMNCVAMAIVLRIDVENRRLMRGKMA